MGGGGGGGYIWGRVTIGHLAPEEVGHALSVT